MVEEESDPFCKTVKNFYNPQFKQQPAQEMLSTSPVNKEENFREKGVPFLQKVKENPTARKIAEDNGVYVGNPIWHEFLIIFFVLVIIGGIIAGAWSFGYGVYNDKFKSDINQSITINPIFNTSVDIDAPNNNEFTINNPLNSTCLCNPTIIVSGCNNSQ